MRSVSATQGRAAATCFCALLLISSASPSIAMSAVAGTPSPTPAPSITPAPSPTPLPSATPVPSPTPLPSATATGSPTPIPSATPKPSGTPIPSATPAPSNTPVPSPTPRPSPTPQPSATPVPTPSGTATPTASATPPVRLINISTRARVGTDQRALIGGFIVIGPASKRVILRALGRSLGAVDVLADPSLQLFNADGAQVYANDNWRDTQETEIRASGIAPRFDEESAIIQTLPPGRYTAVVTGVAQTTGLALFEAYDLDQSAASQLVNISTRSFVGTDGDVLIGGFTIANNPTNASATVVIRAIGPSLAGAGIIQPLQDPQLELYLGDLRIAANDDWQTDINQAGIVQVGLQPQNARESALITKLLPGQYTAVILGASRTTGVGLVEVYNVTQQP